MQSDLCQNGRSIWKGWWLFVGEIEELYLILESVLDVESLKSLGHCYTHIGQVTDKKRYNVKDVTEQRSFA